MIQPSGVDVIDVDDKLEEKVPTRLTATSIGRLKTRRVDQRPGYFNCLFYGDPGAGKTLLAGMAALIEEMSPVLFVDFEGGTAVLDHLGDAALDNIEILPGEGAGPLQWTDVQTIYNYLWSGKHHFKTVVVDSATEAQAVNMGHLLGYDTKVDIDATLPKFDEWNETTSQMRRMFRGFRDLRMHTIFTALPYEEPHPRSTKDNPRTIVRPSLSKKLRAEAPAFFNMVMYLYAKAQGRTNVRFVQTDKDETITARCRIPGVPLLVKSPTLEGLFDMTVRNPQRSAIDFSGKTTHAIGASAEEANEPKQMMRKKS